MWWVRRLERRRWPSTVPRLCGMGNISRFRCNRFLDALSSTISRRSQSQLNIRRFLAKGYWFFLLFNIWWALELMRLQKYADWEDALDFFIIYIIPVSVSYLITIVASVVSKKTLLRLLLAQIPLVLFSISYYVLK